MEESHSESGITLTALLLPLVYSGICIFMSIFLVQSLENHPQLNPIILYSAFAFVAIALNFIPEYSKSYAPMLFVWVFWISMLSVTWSHWNLVDTGHDSVIAFHEKTYYISVGVHVLCGWLTFLRNFRGYKVALALSIVVAVMTATVPKPRPKSEWLACGQVVAYIMLYLFSHLVVETCAITEGRAGKGAFKILQSSWVLLVENNLLIIIMGTAQGLISMGIVLGREGDLRIMLKLQPRLDRPELATEGLHKKDDPPEGEPDIP